MRVSYFVAQPLRGFQFIGFPFIWLFDSLTQIIMRMLKIESNGYHDLHSEEEIKLLLTESEEGGVIGEASNELIQNVFEFDDRTVRQIFVPRSRIYAIDIDEDFDRHLDTITIE